MTGPLAELRAAWLGTLPYESALALQRTLLDQRAGGTIPDTLLLLEHPHVFTLGRRGTADDVLADADTIHALGAAIYETDRGGEATYHGPGQLVAYPIFSVREGRLGPVAYVRLLEEAIILTLAHWRISGHRVVGKTGVWVGGEPGGKTPKGHNPAGRKIAAIGVRISRGVAMHGFAINVSTDLTYFGRIVPCGMPGLDVASVETLTGTSPAVQEVGDIAAGHLAALLQRSLCSIPAEALQVQPAASSS